MATGVRVTRAFVLLLLLGMAQLARAACTAPAYFARQLQATPDALHYATLGSWYADHQQFGCAVDAFHKVTALAPDSAHYQYLLGLSLYSDGKSADAIAPLRHALQIDSTLTQAHLTLGAALDASGERSAAELEWRLALALDPRSALGLQGLSRDLLADHKYSDAIRLLHPLDGSPALTDMLALDLAAAYGGCGLPEDAVALLRKRLAANPSSLQLAEALSGVLILESRFQDAIAALSPVARQHPLDLQAQILLLQTLVLAHDPGAEALGQKLLAQAPRQWELLYYLGLLHQQGDDYSGARGYFERSIAAKPDNADAYYRLGMVLGALKDEAGAQQKLEKAIALGLDTADVHSALARTLRSLGDTAGAQQQFALYGQRVREQAARAQAADKAQQADQAAAAGDMQQAVQDYRDALSLDPQEAVLAYKLAMSLDKAGDHAGERTALQRAIELDPHMAAAQNQLGYLESGDGNDAAAVQHFELAVTADPSYSKAWLNLAASLCLESKWGEARDALHHVLALEGDNSSAKALLQRIDGMESQAQP